MSILVGYKEDQNGLGLIGWLLWMLDDSGGLDDVLEWLIITGVLLLLFIGYLFQCN